ncbi:hypothetical protein RBI13_23815 [Alcaligenaceae bacterium A4P071]|nr:hypothetical protein [Alcaligenaceae bacterium A4P071]
MDETKPQGSAATAELKIDATLIAKSSLADFQNAVPLLRDLWLINETDQVHGQVQLVLTPDLPFFKPHRWQIDALATGSRYPDFFANPDASVTVLSARRTFWEKATALHAEAHLPAGCFGDKRRAA